MKRFRFSLEKVLELRAYREREAEIELGRTIGILTEIEKRIFGLAQERIKAAGERFSQGPGQIQNYERYILRLDKTRDRLLEDAARAELKVAEAREAYLAASRERKAVDKIRERREQEYRKQMLTEETKILDDISGGSSARKLVMG
ncbi:MAG: flagellar export protein FliJ [Treponema sp.]|jgi:flagellar FliJ protein|nr:flagellar export protein FliJ [Treponema sp.]